MAELAIFRMHAARFAATDATGALLAPGRWHSQGTRVLYAAEHVSLALLETLIHAGGRRLPPRALARIVIPAGMRVESAPPAVLNESASRKLGDQWVRSARTAVLRVPSIAVNGLEHNFVLNPAHPAFQEIRFEKSVSFTLDSRFITLS